MATISIGNIKFNWKGPWSSSTTYAVDDVVSHSGSSYISIQAGSNQNPASASSYWQQMSSAGTNGSDGTDLTSTLTTRGDIVYKGASALERLAKGTQGYVLKQGANDPEWGEAPSGDCVKISTVNASGAADIYMDNVFTNTYKYYRLVYGGVRFSSHTNGAWLRIGFRTGGSSGANHGGTYYQKHMEQYNGESATTSNAGGIQNDSVGVQIANTWNQQTDGSPSATSSDTTYAPYRGMGMLDFFYPTQDNYKPGFIYKTYWNDNGHIGYSNGIGYNNSKITSGGITGLRINCESHNIATGFFTLYGFSL